MASNCDSNGQDNLSYVPDDGATSANTTSNIANEPSETSSSHSRRTSTSASSRDIRITIPNSIPNSSSEDEDGGPSPPPYVISTEMTQRITTVYKSDMPPPSYFSPEVQGNSGFTVTEPLPQISTDSLQPASSRREAINVTVNVNQRNTEASAVSISKNK